VSEGVERLGQQPSRRRPVVPGALLSRAELAPASAVVFLDAVLFADLPLGDPRSRTS
jgi:hypothetical protein